MKNIILESFLAIVLFLNMSFANLVPPVIFERISIKLSEIKKINNGNVSYRFNFKNNTKKPIKIVYANTSCTCTIGSYSKEEVLPGKFGYVELATKIESLKKNGTVEGIIKLNTKISPFYKVSIVYDKKL